MRWGTSFRSKLARVTLAYVLALQALLGAWAGLAHAASSQSLDPSLSLCRTVASSEAQSEGRDGQAPHCAVMCLSGACAAGDPPAAMSAIAEFSAPRLPFIAAADISSMLSSAAQSRGLNARGPPSIG